MVYPVILSVSVLFGHALREHRLLPYIQAEDQPKKQSAAGVVRNGRRSNNHLISKAGS
jgi:hypothetical protein